MEIGEGGGEGGGSTSDLLLLFCVHGEQLWSYRDGHLTYPHYPWAGLYFLSG